MPFFLASVQSTIQDAIDSAGYLGLFAVMVIEGFFPPIPSELVLPFAGFQVERGELVFVLALLVATIGATVGAMVIYGLSRWGGRAAILRYRRLLRVSEKDLDKADAWFDRHGLKIVFFGRMIPGVRMLVGIPAGLSEMPIRTYVLVTFAGSAIWNAALLWVGIAIGGNYEDVADYVGPVSKVIVVLLAIGLIAGAVWLYRRSRRRARASVAGA